MTDVLTLGGFTFDGYSTPSKMPGGGKQAMVIHDLPGGARVIDTLGPREDNIVWSGLFWGDTAFADALTIDAMRAAGQPIPLTYAGLYKLVIIDHFHFDIRRLPLWVEYDISCTVYQNPSLGIVVGTTSTIDNLVLADLALGIGL